MSFIPHTDADTEEMLAAVGATSIDELFDEIPAELRISALSDFPSACSEAEIARLMRERAGMDGVHACFAGGGAYEHYIPAAVWEIATRGEFYSSYTPYQAEASQGTLQVLYEYQTMMARLTGMDVANASLYDGASAVAEAVLMAVRSNRRSKSGIVLVPATLNPSYREAMQTLVGAQGISLIEVDFDRASGTISRDALREWDERDVTALVIPQPNFFGQIEDVDELTRWASERDIFTIGVVNPVALALLSPPGEWGDTGVDVACGEGQPLGIPLSAGGPYFGFMTTRTQHVRQLPGRIVGRTVDAAGEPSFTLTLQAREQHIRRARATSNICTNQGLMVTAATIYMSLLGDEGLRRIAAQSHANTRYLRDAVASLPGVKPAFAGPFFHELVLRLARPVAAVIDDLARDGVVAGINLSSGYKELSDCLLVCVTETKTRQEIDAFVGKLTDVLTVSEAG